eukprot:7267657-Pyramimonas_sp.AAC.1
MGCAQARRSRSHGSRCPAWRSFLRRLRVGAVVRRCSSTAALAPGIQGTCATPWSRRRSTLASR